MTFTNQLSEFVFALPFIGMLLSIALGPILLPQFWHHHYFKIALGWMGVCVVFLLGRFEALQVLEALNHTILHDYLPFVILIGALFIITSGIHLTIAGQGTPLTNVGVLAIGGVLASIIGTTGAAMLLIRPLLRLNSYRLKKDHIVIFFIFIVANIGGLLTPLGDPPLFLGYLKGINFTWTTVNLFIPWLMILVPLLIIFYALDRHLIEREPKSEAIERHAKDPTLKIEGLLNLIPLCGVVLVVWLSGVWDESPAITMINLKLSHALRDVLLITFALISWVTTPAKIRTENHFSWEPLGEVAKIFIAIFITIIPVIAMLHSGAEGPFAWLLAKANPNGIPDINFYFWTTGLLSAFLDNAPTYLVFFHMAGGNAETLMTVLNQTLVAISCGAVFMGALSYIGNAPNFMVKSIAEKAGVKMPSFFGYMGWSFAVLIPLFILLNYLYFLR